MTYNIIKMVSNDWKLGKKLNKAGKKCKKLSKISKKCLKVDENWCKIMKKNHFNLMKIWQKIV